MVKLPKSFWLIAPYAAWMTLMAALPATAWAYAVRGVVTAALLVTGWFQLRPSVGTRGLAMGALAGIGVFFIWTAPEMWLDALTCRSGETAMAAADSPYSPINCGWPLTVAKILASALVISVAEELFFRRWLVDFAGFWWMVGLFAVEHGDRWFVGAIAGVIYGKLAQRYGLPAAVVAHALTNLILGLYVVFDDRWFYW